MEYRIGRHAMLPRDLQAPCAQRLEKRQMSIVTCDRCRPIRPWPRQYTRGLSSGHPRAIYRASSGRTWRAALGHPPQSDRPLAAQHLATCSGQAQDAVTLRVDLNQAQHHELPQYGAPLRHFQVRANAERAQPVMPELLDFGGPVAAQDVDDVLGAEAESGGRLAAH